MNFNLILKNMIKLNNLIATKIMTMMNWML